MARVLALTRDLLFGSRVQGALSAAGHEVELIGDPSLLPALLTASDATPAALVVDLTDEELDGAGIVGTQIAEGRLRSTRTLGFYSHVDGAARERAERAGFDVVVPRSRMARESSELLQRLLTPS